MERPQVRIVEPQNEVSTNSYVSSYEESALLAKYGYKPTSQLAPHIDPNSNVHLSFEELVRREEEKEMIKRRMIEERNRFNPVSIHPNDANFYDSNYRTLDDNPNIGFEVKIVSDMKLPKY